MTGPEERLDDILEAVDDAASIASRGRDAFMADPILQRAAKNVVTEIGEAAKALPPDVLDAIPSVPWPAVKGARDRTIHRYREVGLERLWDTIDGAIPELGDAVRRHRS